MKDRVPKYPNRRKITYADGRVEYVTIEYADEPVEAGTIIGKATLLDDTVAGKLGLSETNATVNKALDKAYYLADAGYQWAVKAGLNALAASKIEYGTFSTAKLTFSHAPKIVIIIGSSSEPLGFLMPGRGMVLAELGSNPLSTYYVTTTFSGNTVTWNTSVKIGNTTYNGILIPSSGSTYFYMGLIDRSGDTPWPLRAEFKSSGTFVVPDGVTKIQAHIVGGGGGGGTATGGSYSSSADIKYKGYMGGGSGYTTTAEITVTPGETLNIVVGNGGAAGANGGTSSIKRGSTVLAQALGGKSGNNGGAGGSGGGAADCVKTDIKEVVLTTGGAGGTNGANGGGNSSSYGGRGQGKTTRDFGEADGTLRAKGGAGGGAAATAAVANSGNGGNAKKLTGTSGSSTGTATAGSSGIVLLRWA